MGFNGFLTQRQGPLDFEVRYKAEIFWRAFRETYPQIVSRLCLSLRKLTPTNADIVPLMKR